MIAPPAADAPEVAWLKLDCAALPRKEVLEYQIKKTLFTATVTFMVENRAGVLHGQGSIDAKIPLKGNLSIRAESESDMRVGGSTFSSYRESRDGGRERRWSTTGNRLELKKEGDPEAMRSVAMSNGEAFPLFNPILLLPVLGDAIPKMGTLFATQFVATDKIFALRVEVPAGGREFQISAVDCDAPMTGTQWQAVNWTGKEFLQGSWDPERKVVSNLRVTLPVLGTLDLPLVRHFRE